MDSNIGNTPGLETVPAEHQDAYLAKYKAYRVGVSRAGCVHTYDENAPDYEKFTPPNMYQGPVYAAHTVQKYLSDNLEARIIDAAAGTGLVGEKLKSLGFSNIDALDPSQSMLEEASKKGIYEKQICCVIENSTEIDDDTYDCLVLSGAMINGHVSVRALTDMIRIVKPNGYVVLVMREEYINSVEEYRDRLEPFMKELQAGQKWEQMERSVVRYYSYGKNGVIFVFKVLETGITPIQSNIL